MSSSSLSTSTIIPKDKDTPSPAPQKDYAAAFASLQSSYGANGLAPVLPPSLPATSEKSDSSRPRGLKLFNSWSSKKKVPPGDEPQTPLSTKRKGFKTAFAAFRASCSFGRPSVGDSHREY